MSKFYIASRVSHDDMTKILGRPSSRLNQKMSATLRSVAMKQGIAKTSSGRRLEFYSVDKAALDTLTAPTAASMNALKFDIDWRPLLIVDAEKMSAGIAKVNTKYPRSMTRDLHKQYLNDLESAVEDSVVKIAEDIKSQRKSYPNPGIKVGDWVTHSDGTGRTTYPARVVRVTDKTFSYEVYAFKPIGPFVRGDVNSLFTDDERQQRGIKYTGTADYDGSITVPYKGNEEFFCRLGKVKNKRFSNIGGPDPEDQVSYHHYWVWD